MTDRQKVVSVVKAWVGAKQGDSTHKKILGIYNNHKPLAQGYKVKPTDAWCMTTVSAAFIEAGLSDLIPTECSCPRFVDLAKKRGIWVERDDFYPGLGDIILYDWQDNGIGDNVGNPDHVGVVEKVIDDVVTVIEGNMGGVVGRRKIPINGKNIRGYCAPKFATKENGNRAAVQSRFGFDNNTMAFLDKHPFPDALYLKLATKG